MPVQGEDSPCCAPVLPGYCQELEPRIPGKVPEGRTVLFRDKEDRLPGPRLLRKGCHSGEEVPHTGLNASDLPRSAPGEIDRKVQACFRLTGSDRIGSCHHRHLLMHLSGLYQAVRDFSLFPFFVFPFFLYPLCLILLSLAFNAFCSLCFLRFLPSFGISLMSVSYDSLRSLSSFCLFPGAALCGMPEFVHHCPYFAF